MSAEFESNIKMVKAELADWKGRVLEAIGDFAEGEAKLRAPVGKYLTGQVGGNLRTSIGHHVVKSEDAVQIGTNADYAIYVEKGTAPHLILPKRAKVLSWLSAAGRMFARSVHHPGTRAQPFLTPAVEDNINKIRDIVERVPTRLRED